MLRTVDKTQPFELDVTIDMVDLVGASGTIRGRGKYPQNFGHKCERGWDLLPSPGSS